MRIDELEPGPALDRLVEEKFFRRVPCEHYKTLHLGILGYGWVRDEETCPHKEDTCYWNKDFTQYSRQMGAMECIFKKAKKQKLDITLTIESDGKYTAAIGSLTGPFKEGVSTVSLPHALAIAALKLAKESEA